jgi:hypothetical protein
MNLNSSLDMIKPMIPEHRNNRPGVLQLADDPPLRIAVAYSKYENTVGKMVVFISCYCALRYLSSNFVKPM